MTTALSNPVTFTVTAPSTGAQAIRNSLVAQFPSTPAWSSELSVPAYLGLSGSVKINDVIPARDTAGASNFSAFNAPNTAGNTSTLLYWTGKAKWYAANGGEIWYSAGTTGKYPGTFTLVRYQLATDEFRHWQGDSYSDNVNSNFGNYGCPHNFDGTALNPASGAIYCSLPEPYSGDYALALGVWDTSTKTGTVHEQAAGYTGLGNYYPIEFLPEMGASGTVLVFIYGGAGRPVRRWNLALNGGAGGWDSEISNPYAATMGPTCYFGGKVYFCSGASDLKFYSIDAAGSFDATLPNTPVVMDNGSTLATHAILCPIGSFIYAFVNRSVYRYDPAAKSWGSGAYDTFPWAAVGGDVDAEFTVAPIPTLGVALLVRSIDDWTHQALLWKP